MFFTVFFFRLKGSDILSSDPDYSFFNIRDLVETLADYFLIVVADRAKIIRTVDLRGYYFMFSQPRRECNL